MQWVRDMSAKTKLAVGVEVAVIDGRGVAVMISTIEREAVGGAGGWEIADTRRGTYPGTYSKTGISRDRSRGRHTIAAATDAHRREVWAKGMVYKLADHAVWEKATTDQLEAVAKVLGMPGPVVKDA